MKYLYVLSDGAGIAAIRVMDPEMAISESEKAKEATDGTWDWSRVSELPVAADPVEVAKEIQKLKETIEELRDVRDAAVKRVGEYAMALRHLCPSCAPRMANL